MADTATAVSHRPAMWYFAALVAACSQPAPRTARPAPVPASPAAPQPDAPPRKAEQAARISFTTPGAGVIAAVHDRHAPTWCHTLTLVQDVTITVAGLTVPQTWYLAWTSPGRLRVDIGGASKRDGAIYTPDSVYEYSAGLQTRVDTGVNPLLLLAFDVYAAPMEQTVTALTRHGFNFGIMHEGVFDGHPVYVLGTAMPQDLTSAQIWVDKERLLVLRLIEPTPQGVTDTRYSKFEPVGGGSLATDITQLLDGEPHLHEAATQLHANVPLDSALFDPFSWRTAKSWHGG